MRESVVWKLSLPEVTLEEVFQAEGADYSKRQPRLSIIESHQQIMAEAKKLVNPTAVWCEAEVKNVGEQQVTVEDGQKLTSRLLAKMSEAAEKLILFTVTIGHELDDRIAEYNQAKDTLKAFTLDSVGTVYIVKSAMSAMERIREHYHSIGMSTTFPMGPGHSYWRGLGDMRTIFKIVGPERVGLRLIESNLMMPRKSVAMVMGVGSRLPELMGKSHCDFCDLQNNCQLRTGTGPIC